MKKRVLIIKTGWSETLDPDDSGAVSLGDILRTTVILHLFAGHDITWLVDRKGLPLLKGNPFITRLLVVHEFISTLLLSEQFDIIINLEKDLGICAMSDRIPSWRRYGYRLDSSLHEAVAYDYSETAINLTRDSDAKKNHGKSWSRTLYEMLGAEYNGENYVLGYQPRAEILHDVGFNHLIGSKFPEKAWPELNWKILESLLRNSGYSISWQQGTNDLHDYMDWIASCNCIVTNDSLGLHIAIALGKQVIALFGPTLASEVEGETLTSFVSPDGRMESITPEWIFEAGHQHG